jgi:tetratricopeptide (TPR) repeat protein
MAKKVNLWKKVVSLLGILCYLVLLPTLSLAQEPHDIEQLQKELKYSSGQQRLNVLKDIVTYYYKVSYQEANQYLEQYLELAQANQSSKDLAQAYYFYSIIALNQLEYEQAIIHSKKALTFYEALGDSLQICHQCATISRAFVSLRQADSALCAISIALDYYKRHQLNAQIQSIKIQLGKAYYISDQYVQAHDILQEVVSQTRIQKQYNYVAWALYWLGTTNVRLGNFEEAIANFEEGIQANARTQNIAGKLGTMQELGDMYLKIGEFANAYQLYFDCYQQKDVVKGYQGELQFTADYLINLGKIYHNTAKIPGSTGTI